MHLACAYLEGKSVHPVSPQDLKEALAQSPLTADASMDDEGPLDVTSTSDSMETLSTRGALAAAHAGARTHVHSTSMDTVPPNLHACLHGCDLCTNSYLSSSQRMPCREIAIDEALSSHAQIVPVWIRQAAAGLSLGSDLRESVESTNP